MIKIIKMFYLKILSGFMEFIIKCIPEKKWCHKIVNFKGGAFLNWCRQWMLEC